MKNKLNYNYNIINKHCSNNNMFRLFFLIIVVRKTYKIITSGHLFCLHIIRDEFEQKKFSLSSVTSTFLAHWSYTGWAVHSIPVRYWKGRSGNTRNSKGQNKFGSDLWRIIPLCVVLGKRTIWAHSKPLRIFLQYKQYTYGRSRHFRELFIPTLTLI